MKDLVLSALRMFFVLSTFFLTEKLIAQTSIQASLNHSSNISSIAAYCSAHTDFQEMLAQLKSCPPNALTYYFARCMRLVSPKYVKGYTALHIATWWNCRNFVYALLEQNVSIDAQDWYGRTALHLAAYNANIRLFCLLVAYQANIYAYDKAGWTIGNYLHYAHSIAQREVPAELLQLILPTNSTVFL